MVRLECLPGDTKFDLVPPYWLETQIVKSARPSDHIDIVESTKILPK